jgi:5-methylcytosine-specific restriction endonuclease McrA
MLSAACPVWGDKEKIRLVYQKAKEWGFEVDHVVPIKNEIVCGLHVWANLQLLDKKSNMAKGNKVWPDMPE